MIDLEQKKWHSLLVSNKNSFLLDVRTKDEYEDKHIKGATLIDINSPNDFMEKINYLDKKKEYFVYCRSGARSLNACLIMNNIGIDKTYNLKGGIIEWNDQDLLI